MFSVFFTLNGKLDKSNTIKQLGAVGCNINSGGLVTLGKINVLTLIFTTTSDITVNATLITGLPLVEFLKCVSCCRATGTDYALYLQNGGIKTMQPIPNKTKLYITVTFIAG